jgi:hypothetical protein
MFDPGDDGEGHADSKILRAATERHGNDAN